MMERNNWHWFNVGKLFSLQKCKCSNATELLEEGDEIAYIGAKKSDNGVMQNVKRVDELVSRGNCIVFIGDGQGSVGYCIYQPVDFIGSTTLIAGYNEHLNPIIAMFLIAVLDKERYRYSFGRKYKKETIANSKIQLPAIKNAENEYEPDWQYMETFVKDQIIPQLPKKAQKVWLQKYDTKPLQEMTMKLNTDEWKWFVIKEIFEVKAGKYHYNHEYEGGNTPYLTATAVNNGVGEMISLAPEFEGGIITTEKVKCTAFYQPFPFCATSDVNIIKRKDGKPINQYVGIFLSTIINFNESFRWTYGRQCRVNDTENIRIKLPAIKNNKDEYEPDWQFMEDYIKSLPYSKNIEPSDPNEIVDELVEMKKEMIKMRRVMEAHQAGEVHLHIDHVDTFNDNSRHISLDSGEK